MPSSIPRNLLEFTTSDKDYPERISDFCLKLPRLAGGYYVSKKGVNSQLEYLIAKIFAGILTLILAPIALFGLFVNYLSTSHYFKYSALQNPIKAPILKFHRVPKQPLLSLTYAPTAKILFFANPIPSSFTISKNVLDQLWPKKVVQKQVKVQVLSLTYAPSSQVSILVKKISSLSFKPIILPASILTILKSQKKISPPLLLTYIPPVDLTASITPNYFPIRPKHFSFELLDEEVAGPAPMNEPAPSGVLSLLRRRVQKFLTDPDHMWKQRKYELFIQALIPAVLEDKKLCQGIDSPIANKIKSLFHLIESKDHSPRKQHHAIVEELRVILSDIDFQILLSKKIDNPTLSLPELESVLKLCNAFYKDVEIHSFCSNLVDRLLLEGSRENSFNLSVEQLSLEQQFEAIEKAPHQFGADRVAVLAGNLSGASGIAFDPALLGNISHLLYTLPESLIGKKPIDCLRFGNPTISGLMPGSSKIDPIFEGFLASLMLKNETHVYFSLQDGRGIKSDHLEEVGFYQRATCPDLDRTCKILALEKRFRGHFFPVVFAQDSSFYKQEKEWAVESLDCHKFKHDFLEALTDQTGKSGFYFPEVLRTQQFFKRVLPSILDDVHEAVFEKRLNLSRDERKDFIEISYVFIELYILRKIDPNSFNNACKDAIDRAGKLNRLLFEVLNMLVDNTGKEAEIEAAKRAITHAPAFMVKKQIVVEERRHRLITALEKLQRKGVREKIRKIIEGSYGFALDNDRLILPFGPDDSSL